MSDAAKMSAQIKSIDAKKEEELKIFGKLCYQLYTQYGGNLTKEEVNIVERIQKLDEQKQMIVEELQRIKKAMFCPNCNAEVSADSKFCSVCGWEFDIQSGNADGNMAGRVCPQCGTPLESDHLYCTNCGARVEFLKTSEEKVEAGNILEQVEIEPSIKICPNCGHGVQEEQKFCILCGTKL